MFDLITIITHSLDNAKIDGIVWRNGLQVNSEDGVICYSNKKTKNLIQQKGIYINIETNGKLTMKGSLHKYYNETSGLDRNNHNMFLMSEARSSVNRLLFDKGIDQDDAYVYAYEIGLNLNVTKDCRTYISKMKSIGAVGSERLLYVDPLYVNPAHKNERMKITGFKGVRKYHKVYDKVFESIDKKRKVIPDGNILRIETAMKRLNKCHIVDFFDPDNLKKMVEAFFRDWRTVQFDQDIITPKGTGRAKRQLCLDIMSKGKDAVLIQAKEHHEKGSLSDWEYRNIREFILYEWDAIKKSITFIKSDEEMEFRELLKINYTLLKNDEFNN